MPRPTLVRVILAVWALALAASVAFYGPAKQLVASWGWPPIVVLAFIVASALALLLPAPAADPAPKVRPDPAPDDRGRR